VLVAPRITCTTGATPSAARYALGMSRLANTSTSVSTTFEGNTASILTGALAFTLRTSSSNPKKRAFGIGADVWIGTMGWSPASACTVEVTVCRGSSIYSPAESIPCMPGVTSSQEEDGPMSGLALEARDLMFILCRLEFPP